MANYAKFDVKHAKFGFEIGAFNVLLTKENGRPVVHHSFEFKGKKYASIRELWFDDTANKWMPGKGITLSPQEMPQLCKAMQDALAPTSKPDKGHKRIAAKVIKVKFSGRGAQ